MKTTHHELQPQSAYTLFNIEEVTDEINAELNEKYDLHLARPRKSLDGKQGIATGIFEHPKVTTSYLTQAEAEALMLSQEWTSREELNNVI